MSSGVDVGERRGGARGKLASLLVVALALAFVLKDAIASTVFPPEPRSDRIE